jgi:type IV pilus assembly protein PilB
MKLKANRLGEMLLEAGLIDQFQLDSALSMQRNLGGRIGSALVKLGYLPEETIMEFLESQSKFSRVSLQDLDIPLALITMLPAEKLKHLLVVPIELRQSGQEKTLRVAMTDPTNQRLISDLQFATGCRVLPVLASEDEIREALKNNLPVEPPKAPEPQLSQPLNDPNLIDFAELPTDDPRLDRLLEVLQEKGVLSAIDVQRIKYD